MKIQTIIIWDKACFTVILEEKKLKGNVFNSRETKLLELCAMQLKERSDD